MGPTIYTHRDSNIRKTWLLMTVFFIVVMLIGWGVSYYFDSPILLVIAVGIAIVMNVTSYWFSDTLVVKMTGAQEVPDSGEAAQLHNIVENLAITAGLPKPKIYMVNDPAPNAFATGRDPEHAVVAVTSGLLQILDRSELEGVLAHELSHIGNRDMLVSTMVVVLVGFVAIIADIFLRTAHMGSFGGDNRDNRGAVIFFVFAIIAAILAPIAAQLIQLAISRKREFLADASGALLTRYPEGLASALQKISGYSRPMQRANHATAHLFIANPFAGKDLRSSITRLFMTHPPMEDRVRALTGR